MQINIDDDRLDEIRKLHSAAGRFMDAGDYGRARINDLSARNIAANAVLSEIARIDKANKREQGE